MRVIAIMNQKGGVGKTTTALNLAHALGMAGKRVVAMDLDPQANLTLAFGLTVQGHPGMDKVLLDCVPVEEVCRQVRENVCLVPAGARLGEMEFLQSGGAGRGFRLQEALARMTVQPDFVIIDSPPSAGLLGMNSLLGAHELLVPISSDFLSMQGLSRLMGIARHVEQTLHRHTKKWLVVTRYQDRRRLAREVREKLLDHFPRRVLKTAIHECVALAESPSFGQTIFDYQRLSRAARDYLELAGDVVEGRAH